MVQPRKYVIFTDGSCWPNPGGTGGWGALIILDGQNERMKIKGGERNTTNNRMELMAAIKALQALPGPSIVALMSDSKYMRSGITEWINGWKKNGWMTKEWKGRPPQPVKNADLWRELDALQEIHAITWKWVPGHSGISGNEQADRLAADGRAELVNADVEAAYAANPGSEAMRA